MARWLTVQENEGKRNGGDRDDGLKVYIYLPSQCLHMPEFFFFLNIYIAILQQFIYNIQITTVAAIVWGKAGRQEQEIQGSEDGEKW